jgi:hypothetical protein
MDKLMTALGYIWCVIRNLIEFLIVLGILYSVHERFQMMVMTVLGILYVTIRSVAIYQGMTQISFTQALDFEFVRIRNLLGDARSEDEQDLMREGEKNRNRLYKKIYINGTFLFFIWCLCVYKLVTAE